MLAMLSHSRRQDPQMVRNADRWEVRNVRLPNSMRSNAKNKPWRHAQKQLMLWTTKREVFRSSKLSLVSPVASSLTTIHSRILLKMRWEPVCSMILNLKRHISCQHQPRKCEKCPSKGAKCGISHGGASSTSHQGSGTTIRSLFTCTS